MPSRNKAISIGTSSSPKAFASTMNFKSPQASSLSNTFQNEGIVSNNKLMQTMSGNLNKQKFLSAKDKKRMEKTQQADDRAINAATRRFWGDA